MPGPTAYTPTTKNIARYLKPFFSTFKDVNGKVTTYGVQEAIQHGIDMGCTYVNPFMELPIRWFHGSPEYFSTLEYSKDLALAAEYFRLIKSGNRGAQPFGFNNNRHYEHISDQLGSTYQTTNLGYYTNNWSTLLGTGNAHSPWGLCGACLINETWAKACKGLCLFGVTLDYVMMDSEAPAFSSYRISVSTDTRIPLAIINDSRYTEEWQGLSSWQYYFEGAGGTTLFGINNKSFFNEGATNDRPWDNAFFRYDTRLLTLANYEPVVKYFANISFSNYGSFKSDGFTAESTGIYFTNSGGNVGNAPSTVNYTTIPNARWIPEGNSRTALVFAGGRGRKGSELFPTSASGLLVACNQFRNAKRNSPNSHQHPWIGTVNKWTQVYPTTIWSPGDNQSDPNVLEKSWNKENFAIISRGITAPDGSTNAYVLQTPTVGVCATTGVYGATGLLNYYEFGLTPGYTYTFSYYIDLSRGFTAQKFNIQTWRKYLSYEGTTQGITYTQILPIGTGPFFRENLIGFSSGDSGWTKVAFQFQGITNPYISLSAYYARNDVTTGTAFGLTSYIWNVALEMDQGGGITSSIPITDIDARRYEVSTTYPTMVMADAQKGYNPNMDAYFTRRGGNSGYYYEMIRHFALMGTKVFGYYNNNLYMDYRAPGLRAIPGQKYDTFTTSAIDAYRYYGLTSAIPLYKDFNDCLHDINTKLGGFTLTTAELGYMDWLSSYAYNGAPIKGGTSWLWRITSLPGHTTYCNGETLSPNGKIGTWVTTPGPTLAGVSLYTTPWPMPSEIGVTTPTRDFNFLTMSSVSDLTSAGFTFIRGSTATYINNQGKLVVVSGNTPRFAYYPDTLEARGLMVEPSAINQLNWSESFANTGGANNNWIDTNLVRATGNTSPSDSLNAILFTATGSNATLISTNSIGITRERCLSFWMKGITGNESAFYTFNNGITWNNISNLTTSWKRFEYGPNTGNHRVGFRIGNTGDSIYIWGVQLERSKSESLDANLTAGITLWTVLDQISSSYIPTQGATAQRNNEFLYIPNAGFSAWLGLTFGTFIYEAENMHQGTFTIVANNSVWYGMSVGMPFDNYMTVSFVNHPSYNIGQNSPFFIFYPWQIRTASTVYKIGINYKPRRFGIASNGYMQSTSDQPLFPGFQTIYNNGSPVNELNMCSAVVSYTSAIYARHPYNPMYLRRLRYWNKYFEESLMKVLTLGDIQPVYFNYPTEATREAIDFITSPSIFKIENSQYLI